MYSDARIESARIVIVGFCQRHAGIHSIAGHVVLVVRVLRLHMQYRNAPGIHYILVNPYMFSYRPRTSPMIVM